MDYRRGLGLFIFHFFPGLNFSFNFFYKRFETMSSPSAPTVLLVSPGDFPQFSRFPYELRTRVWFFALPGPRIVPVGRIYINHYRHRLRQFEGPLSYCGLPTTFFICKESRLLTSRHYSFWDIYDNKDTLQNADGSWTIEGSSGYCHPGFFDFSCDSLFVSAQPYTELGFGVAEMTLPGIRLPQALQQPIEPMTLYLRYADIQERLGGPRAGRKTRLKPFCDMIFGLRAVHRVVLVLHNPYGRLIDGGPDDVTDVDFHLPFSMLDIRVTNGVENLIEDPELFRGLKSDHHNPPRPDGSWPNTYNPAVIVRFEKLLGQLAQSSPLHIGPTVCFGVEVHSSYNPVDGPRFSVPNIDEPEMPEWVRPPLAFYGQE